MSEGQTNLGGTVAEISVREIARSIAAELRKHPERWTQGAVGKDASGLNVSRTNPSCQCLCLLGHIWNRCDPDGHYDSASFARRELVQKEFYRLLDKTLDGVSISTFNDAPERTVTDIIALCDRVAAGEQQ